MTSFTVVLEPRPQPRLAAGALLLHLAAAAAPWCLSLSPAVAAGLALTALAGLPATLGLLPGAHGRLRSLRLGPRGGRALLAGGGSVPARLDAASRAGAGLVFLALRTPRGRRAWCLARGAVPEADFRRLKSLIRLAC